MLCRLGVLHHWDLREEKMKMEQRIKFETEMEEG